MAPFLAQRPSRKTHEKAALIRMTALLSIDLHAHTNHSPDGGMHPRDFVARMRECGIDRAAVTDHGRISGALEARELDPELIIVGEEIRCECGTELIGLFLTSQIHDGYPMREVADRIRDQGGVVYAPHPFAYPRGARWRAKGALAVADVAEVFNGRAFLPSWNRMARSAVTAAGLPAMAGSDAHFTAEVGRAFTRIGHFTDAESFLREARNAEPVGLSSGSPVDHLASTALWASWALRRFGRGAHRRTGTP